MAAPREELIQGAVTFLQDPSVASAPYEQKLSFLRSKNLTQDEIDASLARVGQAPSPSDPSSSYPPPQPQYRPQQQQQQAYPQYGSNPSQYPPPAYWQHHPPPPDLPRRDWRDWFIMATVVSGFGYACYWTAQRYILPLISPPTPPQLEQDKHAVDESFERAFALLDQLASDTTELKESEKARTEKLDSALGEVEAVVGRMREANENREAEGRRLAREVESLREGIPRAIEKERERDEERLKELVAEVRSLKTLVGNRMGGGSVGSAQQQQPQLGFRGNTSQATTPQQQQQPLTNGSAPTAPVEPQQNGSSPAPASNGIDTVPSTNPSQSSSPFPDRAQANSSPFERSSSGTGARGGGGGAGKAAIPSWQLAAKKRSEEQQQAQKSSAGESGAGGEVGGADKGTGTGTGARVEDARE
ncbi:hypothetical protein KC332_g17154 [Hortaea werneckii]|uniref:Peroxisomal membrane protein PEX14 n=1 Tax=Hortaea werneckii TaxID=91943 RepID=A0A3M7I2D6_HORWE|nr:hypothetical protein KC358_g16929 [Hortaea werneckii]KAI6807794.1 hypothetical protein KC350_g13623 [Hortaea werneckii]KAI6907960.1 hypothetical protein KC348_g14038 [Hortaea werneckii]KAI6918256.1 hypothetical protein KC341_g17987 [Hortaea werneckii]KAI6958810.1 hypothetical protein KC321_g13798 [Hortaea werneckii]